MRNNSLVRLILFPVVMTAAMVAWAAPAAADGQPASKCTNVSGDLDAVGIPQFSGGALTGFHVIVTQSSGDLAGATITADLVVQAARPGGLLQFDGAHFFELASADLDIATDDFVRISPGGVVNDTLLITSGGTGLLHTHGSADLSTGAVHLDYHGRICA